MLRNTLILVSLMILATGCGVSFPDEEMHFGLETKARPYAVVVEPPDAAPGETVTVTLFVQAPDPAEMDITWQAALDYNIGLYGADEVERSHVQVPVPPVSADADGFMTQEFQWVVPDSVHLWTSAIPEVLDDPLMVALAEALLGDAASSPPRKVEVDAWLRDLTAADVAAMEPSDQEATWALADRFACQIRFRAQLRTDLVVDVTRNLTVRHTGRLGGPNKNENARINSFAIIAVNKLDADRDDISDPAVEKTWYRFIDEGVRVADEVAVPVLGNRTWFSAVSFEPEEYASPFEFGSLLSETGSYRWYYYRQDAPGSEHQLMVTEDGDEAEMWALKEEARIIPAGVGSRFRIVAAVRDERSEWSSYHLVPGIGVVEGVVEFVAP